MNSSALVAERLSLIQELQVRPSGEAWCQKHSDLIDRVLVALSREIEQEFQNFRPLTLVAVGGYGRRQLSPHSDVDLVLIPSDEQQVSLDGAVRLFYRRLNEVIGDDLGLKIDYGYRPLSDAPGLDPKSRTGLLDARLIAGSDFVFTRFMDLYWSSFPVGDFVVAKYRERERWLANTHRTPLVTKPNLRDGAGGMRCIHCAHWVGQAIGMKMAKSPEAQEAVLIARNILHALTGEKNDWLTPDRQIAMADWLKQDPHAMMQNLLQALTTNHELYQESRERLAEARFPLARGVWSIRGEVRFMGDVEPAAAAFGVARAIQLGVDVPDVPARAKGRIAGESLMRALGENETTLRELDRCGLLEQLLPCLTRCRTLLPDDLSHEFTVFEHTMMAVRTMHELASRTDWLGELYGSFEAKPALHLATLLHDVGKFEDGPRHPEIGAEIAERLALEWNLEPRHGQLISWLIRNHLQMSRFVRFRDLALPETVEAFAQIVGSTERLNALTLITYADSMAVGPHNWSPMQEQMLRELHERTWQFLHAESADEEGGWMGEQVLVRPQVQAGSVVSELVDALPGHYLLATSAKAVERHSDMYHRYRESGPQFYVMHHKELGVSELFAVCQDQPGLLSRILGVIYASDMGLTGVRAFTSTTDEPFVVDAFTLDYNGQPLPDATTRSLIRRLHHCMGDDRLVEQLLQEKGLDPHRLPAEATLTLVPGPTPILEVLTQRNRGVAYQISRFFRRQGWEVIGARVGQWAGETAAAFYIRPGQGINPQPEMLLEQWSAEVSSARQK